MDDILIHKAAEIIRAGGVVMIPTDTCYGLAADPYNERALQKLFAIKHRAPDKKISCIYSSIVQITEHVPLTAWQKSILEKNLPGPFTFIINGSAVRISEHPFNQALALALGSPYTATSANISSNPPLYSTAGVAEEFGNLLPDLVIDFGDLPNNPPSTVADLSNDKLTILRPGTREPLI